MFHSFENVLSRILLYTVKIVLKVEKKRVLFVKEGDTLTTKTSEEKHTDQKLSGNHHNFEMIDVYVALPL